MNLYERYPRLASAVRYTTAVPKLKRHSTQKRTAGGHGFMRPDEHPVRPARCAEPRRKGPPAACLAYGRPS